MDDIPEVNAFLKESSRKQMWDIWQTGKQGGALDEEAARMYELMEGHMQYAPIWDRLNEITDDEISVNGVNIILHMKFHLIIENQLAANTPPAVRQVMQVLKQKGLTEHDAAHAVASVMAFELHDMLKENRNFDLPGYIRELRKLPLKVKPRPKKKK